MKICFIGLGSIGQRHLKNLTTILTEKKNTFVIDAVRQTALSLHPELAGLIQNEFTDFNELPDDYDIIFITNPTNLHFSTLCKIKNKAKYIFIEKPVGDIPYPELSDPEFNSDKYYIACPLRHTAVIQYLKDFCNKNKIIAARSICSTYLPDWRSNSDYTKSYSAHKEFGGGVLIDLIHEWDYLTFLFGFPEKLHMLCGTFSNLAITSEDSAVYIAKYPSMLASLHLDYFGKKNRREIELFTNSEVIVGDLINATVTNITANEVINFSEKRNEYQVKELQYFLSIVAGKSKNFNTIPVAIQVLRTALGEK